MLKNYTLLIVTFLAQYSFCQESLIINVVDQDSENPIYGAALTVNDTLINFSDENGKLEIDSKYFNKADDDQYCFTHMSYGTKCLTFNEVKALGKINLQYHLNELDEVVLNINSENHSYKEILKKAKKYFKESSNKGSYWSKINLKEVNFMYNEPQSYLEIEGSIFMNFDYSLKTMFWSDFLLPKQVRRIEESTLLKTNDLDFKRKKGIIQNSVHFAGNDLFFAYRTYLKLHPFGNKSNKYLINFLDEEIIDGNNYYVLEYSRNENVNIKGRGFSKNYGKIWLNKADFSIFKEQISFHFENLKSFTMAIDHITYDNKNFPIKIKSTSYSSNVEKSVSIKSVLTFKEIDPNPRDFIEDSGTGISFLYNEYPYNKNYWNIKSRNINSFENEIMALVGTGNRDEIFTKGNLSPIYETENKISKYWYSLNEDKWKFINKLFEKDFKNSTNKIKLNPEN